MNPITIPNTTIPVIGLPTIGIPPVGFPSASGGGLVWPAGLKESIKAIYDPASQGMTNYDVIESYAEDFTNWIFRNNVADATIANNKLIITETKAQNDRFIYSTNANEDLILYITGIDTVGVCYYNGSSTLALNNGLNKIHTNKGYIDIRSCRGIGACNITITQLPTSILKDLSGNGNHAYLYGGKGKLNSGMGVYKFDFLSDLLINSAYLPYTERQYDSICSLAGHPNGWLFQYKSLTDIPTFKIEVKGIVNDKFHYSWYDENGNRGVDFVIDKDGIYEFPMSYSVETNTGVGIVCNNICQDNVCFTQIPDYPNQLCYDGKMYAVCYGFPILTDYTVMADRTWFKDKLTYWSYFISKQNVFECERISVTKEESTGNFGLNNNVTIVDDRITYQNKSFYNNQIIRKGNNIDNGSPLLISGTPRSFGTENFIGCHGKIIIADRSFTEDEITWLKDNWKKI